MNSRWWHPFRRAPVDFAHAEAVVANALMHVEPYCKKLHDHQWMKGMPRIEGRYMYPHIALYPI